jgi:hypothetical protein
VIKTCKYCARQERSCDECKQPVICRTVSEVLPDKPYRVMATFLLCTNIECKEYAHFNREDGRFIETFTCDSVACKERAKYYNPEVLTS